MKSNHETLVVAAHLCLGLSFVGCVADSSADSDKEKIGEVMEAWSWDAPQRGWVDTMSFTHNGYVEIHGWACLKSGGTTDSSSRVSVYQGGPPGQGVQQPITSHNPEYRGDTAIACITGWSGFHILALTDYTLPSVFEVSYHEISPAVTLEGTKQPDNGIFDRCGHGCPSGWHGTSLNCDLSCIGACTFGGGNEATCAPNSGTFDMCGFSCPAGWHTTGARCNTFCSSNVCVNGGYNSVTCQPN